MVESTAQQLSEEELAAISVRCLAVDLYGVNLLLPNTLVAEVTEITTVNRAAHAPEWMAGFVIWRGRSVPLVSFEQLLGMEALHRHDDNRMVILNTLNGNLRVPFIAMEIQGLPRLSLVKHGMLEFDEGEKNSGHVVLSTLRVEGESMIVPNIDVIERMLEELVITA
jgi:chemosensory pili system protein ChpC